MSKKKLKDKVSHTPIEPTENRRARRKRLQKEKRKWTNPKDFNFLKPVKWLPGFRTCKHWKRIMAIVYYCVCPVAGFLKFGEFQYFGLFLMIMLLTLPFMLCSFTKYLQTKDRFYATEALIAAAIFGCDNIVMVMQLRELMNTLA